MIKTLVFNKNGDFFRRKSGKRLFFAENWQKSPKKVVTTLTPFLANGLMPKSEALP
jgi:hypothetical protein